MEKDYGIELRLITTANPQANAVVERIHQVVGNMIRTMGLDSIYLLPPPSDPFAGVIAAICYAVRSTWHSTLQATPGQIVFSRDMMLNIRHIADWNAMQERRQAVANNNNRRENSRRIAHQYSVGDEVMKIKGNPNDKSLRSTLEETYEGPYIIHKVHSNGTVTIKKSVRRGARFERLNIRRIRPYHRRSEQQA